MQHRYRPPSDTLAALAALDLLQDCPADDLARLCRDADLIDIPADGVIDVAGASARQFVGIVDGYVWALGDGHRDLLGPGSHLGAAELLDRRLHTRTYVAAGPLRVVTVFGPAFRAVARWIPGVPDAARTEPAAQDLDPRPLATLAS